MSQAIQKQSRPIHPYLVLAVAIVLPGVGQVLNHAPMRGLMMVFFMMVLGVITFNLAAPDVSLVGQFAGGVFIYALSVMDAYMWARLRWTLAQQN
ncbi:hypothetical protein [Methylophaga sp. OBS4]|uniref:hypothetical protein n=1 Tax=Methylophaga sp. OBS4 TaxID=2991935 RepID=UPI00225A9B68|nr:hypothetical protein [Methylophaga sp. OBS4]MCX4187088.1 hypothetical protein [Methylophaga sp. OBS4]